MKKRVFKSVPEIECYGVSWRGTIIRSSLRKLLEVFQLNEDDVVKHSINSKTRYELHLKTYGIPAFSIYDRCAFSCGHIVINDFDKVVSWHLGTFNEYVDSSTRSLFLYLGLVVNGFVYDKSEHCLFEIEADDLSF